MAPRRTHQKSRSGCQVCKRRRVKCDERHPRCGNCTKHGVECDFTNGLPPKKDILEKDPPTFIVSLPSTESVSSTSSEREDTPFSIASTDDARVGLALDFGATSPSVPSSRSSTPGSVIELGPRVAGYFDGSTASPGYYSNALSQDRPSFNRMAAATFQPLQFSLLDMELYHSYFTITAPTLGESDLVNAFWRRVLPQVSFKHPFVMHSVLSLAALHRYQGNRSDENLLATTTRHTHAVNGMLYALNNVSKDNADAVFATSSLLVVYAIASSRFNSFSNSGPQPIGDWMPLVRGIKTVISRTYNWIIQGNLAMVFNLYNPEERVESLTEETEDMFANLYRLCSDTTLDDQEDLNANHELYMDAVIRLRRSFALLATNFALGPLFLWPIVIDPTFFQNMAHHRPRALIIFAHYCILFILVRHTWWFDKLSEYELQRIENVLRGTVWEPWLEWPRKMVAQNGEGCLKMRVEELGPATPPPIVSFAWT